MLKISFWNGGGRLLGLDRGDFPLRGEQCNMNIFENSNIRKKMPQRRDNAGAVCDSGIGMLFLNCQFLTYRRLLRQKMG